MGFMKPKTPKITEEQKALERAQKLEKEKLGREEARRKGTMAKKTGRASLIS